MEKKQTQGGLQNAQKTPQTPVVETPVVETPVVPTPVVPTPVVDAKKAEEDAKQDENQKVILFNVLGEEMPKEDYFYKGIVPAGFEGTCGKPVDREDLITVFHKVFKPKDNILFYRQADKEVYLVIIPLKYAIDVGESEDSFDGDFQKHAISFIDEGSVNLDTLRKKFDIINTFVKYSDR